MQNRNTEGMRSRGHAETEHRDDSLSKATTDTSHDRRRQQTERTKREGGGKIQKPGDSVREGEKETKIEKGKENDKKGKERSQCLNRRSNMCGVSF